ncbi:hypothetical protein [Rathayibacter sp. VKM Ac-2857]|uniref:hypothetical protein n=1 Tax=Rathayibacter sp. VKM Ac-2857 TaxID=2739020 RepID=UPI001564C7BE|nr:hypothetical protein [Rathayibacter sp. VKM Ac-2857]NQX18198.1 hypothetical protein [Rathayibacter sp. VKM Ac-2857]
MDSDYIVSVVEGGFDWSALDALGSVAAALFGAIAVIVAFRANAHANRAQRRAEDIHNELHRPAWLATISPYVVNAAEGLADNCERGTMWSIENVSATPASHVQIESAWPAGVALRAVKNREISKRIEPGGVEHFGFTPEAFFLLAEDEPRYSQGKRWPDKAEVDKIIELSNVPEPVVITVSWIGTDGISQTARCTPRVLEESEWFTAEPRDLTLTFGEPNFVTGYWRRLDGAYRQRKFHVDTVRHLLSEEQLATLKR